MAKDDTCFEFGPAEHEFELTPGELKNFRIKNRQEVCEWAEQNITLVKPSYLYPGRFKAWPWQREPINAFNYWQRLVYVGAVQTFKSGNTDLQAYYSMSVLGLNGMIAYANEKKVLDAFEDRFVPMIKSEENPCLREVWDGKDDSLTKDKLKLTSCNWKIASANNKDDLASFTAPITIGSEVAKWRKKDAQFNPVLLLRSRSDASFALGTMKSVLESSPYEEGDMLYQEVFRNGTLILQPHYKCPYCGHWQILSDYQIKVRDEIYKHNPAAIRAAKHESCFYECVNCKEVITEGNRTNMSQDVVWAAPEIDVDEFKQLPEKINPDGSVHGRQSNGVRSGYDTVCYWWSRLADVAFPFYECLARFFESVYDDDKKKSYENETMARWWKRKTGRVEEKYLESRKREYFMWGERHYIPDEVLVITLGIDSQDDGFYYTYVGWGEMLSWYVLRHGFISCPRVDKGYEVEVFQKFYTQLHIEPLRWKDGAPADYTIALIDRGGHRADDVDFMVSHMPRLHPYIGLTKSYPDRPIIYKSDNGNHYMGQAEVLSEDTGAFIAGDNFFLPADCSGEFMKQIGRQFHTKKMNADGKVSTVWVHNFQGADHYRDTLNLNLGAAKIKNIDKMLINKQVCDQISDKKKTISAPIKIEEKKADQKQVSKNQNNGYFNRAIYGRGYR